VGEVKRGDYGVSAFQAVDVPLQARDEAGMPGDFAVPAAIDGVVVESLSIRKLVLELRQKLVLVW